MNISMKTAVLGVVLMVTYCSLSFADTIYIVFNHKAGTTGRNPMLCAYIYKSGHGAGLNCGDSRIDMSNENMTVAESTEPGLAVGEFYQDHVTTGSGLTSVYGRYRLVLICRMGKNSTQDLQYIDLSQGKNEIDIDVTCPVDGNGNPLQPTYSVSRKNSA
jgi:hypothetical protein